MDLALAPLPGLTAESAADAKAVDALIAVAFGPGRYAKTAERLREGNTAIAGLSFVAREGRRIVGCVRLWPVHVGGAPALFLGPFAVDPNWRSRGLGAMLIERAVAAARAAGHKMIVLVGDGSYFEPLGFRHAPGVILPGPVDQNRVLALPLAKGGDVPAGPLTH
jgi:predicted N-acetyltransferase YhbS